MVDFFQNWLFDVQVLLTLFFFFCANFICVLCFINLNFVMAQNAVSHPIHVILDADNYFLWAQPMT